VTIRRSARPSTDAERERDARDLETAARVAASISRNLGNDLTSILNLSDLLLADGAAAPFAGDVQRIRDAANRAVALDRQLLAFSRRDTGHTERVNLNDVLSGMGQLISTVMGDRYGITSRADPALRSVEASPAQIERIILNLLMNARRSSPAGGGRIAVETANVTIDQEFSSRHPAVAPGEYVSISVSETAREVSADAAGNPDVFHVDASQYSGLPAAFEAIRELGAQVWAFSELGVGSTVRVFFRPAAEPAAADATAAAGVGEETRGSETILIMDGDDEVRTAAARGLKANGYTVLEARSAAEAQGITQHRTEDSAGKIHLIIADVHNGNENSPEAAKALARTIGSPLAWVSSETDAVLAQHGVLDRPRMLLRKPYSAEQMAIFVRSILRRAQD
jgi:CheY-like chemotaxis protein